jgi:hypothetical protein
MTPIRLGFSNDPGAGSAIFSTKSPSIRMPGALWQ